ncbi:MAG: citrate/2-methylcitrate synthase [Planctomycetota bacterium]
MAEPSSTKGLEGVVAGESEICLVDGVNGKLYYRGYSIEELAENSSFEETTFLLLNGELPSRQELDEFARRMRESRELQPAVQQMIADFPRAGSPMELLQSVVAYLSSSVKHRIHHSATCDCRQTLHQVAQMLPVLGTYERFRQGKPYLESRTDLSDGANFLYLLRGEEPSPEEGRVLDACLVLHAEHGFNASTFTARVVASTLSTCYCSISAAIGALAGSLHGGANEKVMEMLDDIGTKENVDPWLDNVLSRQGKVMGMGHRVYQAKDPRSIVIEKMFLELSRQKNNMRYYELLKQIETSFAARMQAKGKAIYPNVDFFSGAVYTLMGIPRYLYTPIFAASRTAGWLAHVLEQRGDNRLIRPVEDYVGAQPRPYVPLDQREDTSARAAG